MKRIISIVTLNFFALNCIYVMGYGQMMPIVAAPTPQVFLDINSIRGKLQDEAKMLRDYLAYQELSRTGLSTDKIKERIKTIENTLKHKVNRTDLDQNQLIVLVQELKSSPEIKPLVEIPEL